MDTERLCHSSQIYSLDQIECLCQALCQDENPRQLVRFFDGDRGLLALTCIPSVLRAYLRALFHSGRFQELFKLIKESNFDCTNFAELQNLWFEAKYAEDQQRRKRRLGPVEKYRLRKKNPPPLTISDGYEVCYSFRVIDRETLGKYYAINKYPTAEEKRLMSKETGLSVCQISNWFKNRRQRTKQSSDSSNSPPFAHLMY